MWPFIAPQSDDSLDEIQSWTGLMRWYGGVLVPDGVDERGDIVFRYNGVS